MHTAQCGRVPGASTCQAVRTFGFKSADTQYPSRRTPHRTVASVFALCSLLSQWWTEASRDEYVREKYGRGLRGRDAVSLMVADGCKNFQESKKSPSLDSSLEDEVTRSLQTSRIHQPIDTPWYSRSSESLRKFVTQFRYYGTTKTGKKYEFENLLWNTVSECQLVSDSALDCVT